MHQLYFTENSRDIQVHECNFQIFSLLMFSDPLDVHKPFITNTWTFSLTFSANPRRSDAFTSKRQMTERPLEFKDSLTVARKRPELQHIHRRWHLDSQAELHETMCRAGSLCFHNEPAQSVVLAFHFRPFHTSERRGFCLH